MTAKSEKSRTVEKQGLRAYRGLWSRLLAVALCLSLMIGLVPLMPEVAAHAQTIASGECGEEGNNLTWVLDDTGTLTISGTGEMANFRGDSASWKSVRDSITSVVMEDGVTSIGIQAFWLCQNLTEVVIPDSVTRIWEYAFGKCSNLTDVSIPDGVTSINHDAFWGCSSLTSVYVKRTDDVPTLGSRAFDGTSDNLKIYVPAEKENEYKAAAGWADYAGKIYGFSSINYSVELSGGANATVSGGATGQTGLTGSMETVTYTAKNNYIFPETSELYKTTTGITVERTSDTVITVSGTPTADTYITIPDAVSTIPISATVTFRVVNGSWSDADADKLKGDITVTLNGYEGDELKLLGYPCVGNNPDAGYLQGSWDETPSLDAVFTNGANKVYTYTYALAPTDGIVGGCTWKLSDDLETLTIAKADDGNGDMGDFTLDATNKSAAPWMYAYTSIKTVVIKEGVTNIGHNTFWGCTALTSVTIPDGVEYIGSCAFQDCSSLTAVSIPNSVTYIGLCAFGSCTSLETINLPDSITEIPEKMLGGCSSLTTVNIPDSVKRITFQAFWGCSSLTTVSIPESVTSIGISTFWGCSSLTSVYCYSSNPTESYLHDIFEDVSSDLIIYVLEESIDDYKAICPEYADKIQAIPSVNYTVTFKVVNGSWDDGTTADKTVTLKGNVGDALKLAATNIPAVGTKPSENYLTGSWDVLPSAETTITGNVTYTYTYTLKDDAPNKPDATITVSYGTLKVSGAALPAGWAWATADKDRDLTVGTGVSATAEYTGSNKANYKNTSVSVSVVRSACTHSNLVKTDAVVATCTAAGNSAYWTCSDCGKYFSDANGTNEITENSWLVSKLGHEYGDPLYVWGDDYSTCTATVVCGRAGCNDGIDGHKVSETVNTTSKVIKAATVEAMGTTEYTATFQNTQYFTVQTYKLDNIEKLSPSQEPDPESQPETNPDPESDPAGDTGATDNNQGTGATDNNQSTDTTNNNNQGTGKTENNQSTDTASNNNQSSGNTISTDTPANTGANTGTDTSQSTTTPTDSGTPASTGTTTIGTDNTQTTGTVTGTVTNNAQATETNTGANTGTNTGNNKNPDKSGNTSEPVTVKNSDGSETTTTVTEENGLTTTVSETKSKDGSVSTVTETKLANNTTKVKKEVTNTDNSTYSIESTTTALGKTTYTEQAVSADGTTSVTTGTINSNGSGNATTIVTDSENNKLSTIKETTTIGKDESVKVVTTVKNADKSGEKTTAITDKDGSQSIEKTTTGTDKTVIQETIEVDSKGKGTLVSETKDAKGNVLESASYSLTSTGKATLDSITVTEGEITIPTALNVAGREYAVNRLGAGIFAGAGESITLVLNAELTSADKNCFKGIESVTINIPGATKKAYKAALKKAKKALKKASKNTNVKYKRLKVNSAKSKDTQSTKTTNDTSNTKDTKTNDVKSVEDIFNLLK